MKYARSFSVIYENGLNEFEQVHNKHLKSSGKKMPDKFMNLKEKKLNVNRNVLYSEELEELLSNGANQEIIHKFESSFVSVQIAMVEEPKIMINTFESFMENVTAEDFKNKNEFFELDFSTVTLSDSVKLTDKKVNMKIDTPDI